MAASDPRSRFIEATGELLRRHGYHGTALNDIIKRSGSPRGSLYHYFPGGKDELVMETLRAAGAHIAASIESLLASQSSPRGALAAVFDALSAEFEASNFQRGCPVAATALAVAGDHDEIRAVCAEVYDSWVGTIRDFLAGHGIPARQAADLAAAAVQEYEGALLLARIHRDTGPLHAARDRLLAALGTAL